MKIKHKTYSLSNQRHKCNERIDWLLNIFLIAYPFSNERIDWLLNIFFLGIYQLKLNPQKKKKKNFLLTYDPMFIGIS